MVSDTSQLTNSDNPEEYYNELDSEADEFEDDYDEEFPENGVFEAGDFDYESNKTNRTEAKPLKNARQMFRIKLLEHNPKATKIENDNVRQVTLVNFNGIPIAEDRIFWSKEIEEKTPKGVTDAEFPFILQRLRDLHVVQAQQPTWNRCGRPKNLFMIFEDGSKACARYRAPHYYLVQGEVMSFYLSRILGIYNVPVVVLANSKKQERWASKTVWVEIQKSEWESNTTIALIQWIENLERDKMPEILLSTVMDNSVISAHSSNLYKLSVSQLTSLLQWSDLIIFDYITGNYDRVASMQDAAEKEGKSTILNETIHNLVRSKKSGGLWLIDNESGLIDSYSLLYGNAGSDSRFQQFHRTMLQSMCLFRRKTFECVQWLHRSRKSGPILLQYIVKYEPMFVELQEQDFLFQKLQDRIDDVYNHMIKCRTNS